MSLYFTPRQVADRWGCSANYVRRLARRGELPAMRLGLDAWRISVAAVEAYEAAHTNRPADEPAATTVAKAPPVAPPAPSPSSVAIVGDLALPERWWEAEQTGAASRAAGRARSAGKKRAVQAAT